MTVLSVGQSGFLNNAGLDAEVFLRDMEAKS
jgi:hypothetical protein